LEVLEKMPLGKVVNVRGKGYCAANRSGVFSEHTFGTQDYRLIAL
jgi:hypothetical protein